MSEITLQQLLEAGCHFGHKSERRNPKASSYIYTEKDGIHIIDLAQTKVGLDNAMRFVRELVAAGGEVLFVGTKRQAKDIVTREADRVGAPYVVERWIGGFLTNWEGIQKTIRKILTMTDEEKSGGWKKFPKHEQVKLAHHLKRLNMFYGGVTKLAAPPKALFLVDIKKENVAFREAIRCAVPMIALVDTNVNPTDILYPIPANDDAVGSIEIITKAIADAYQEGKREWEKNAAVAPTPPPPAPGTPAQTIPPQEKKVQPAEPVKENAGVSAPTSPVKKPRAKSEKAVS